MPDNTLAGGGTMEWSTPPELFHKLNLMYAFDYDPFASSDNALLPYYSTKDGTFSARWTGLPNGGAVKIQSPISEADGLGNSWRHLRVFCNPPYTRELIDRCIDKIVDERNHANIIVVLVNAATETKWFRKLAEHSFIEWLPQRVAYIHPPFRCKASCRHILGAPTPGSPSGGVIALLRPDW